jgi:release factor glutamine methyltransferase
MADEPQTVKTLRENIKKDLRGQYPDREINAITDILFRERLQFERHEAGLNRNRILDPGDRQWFEKAIRKLKSGHPVQHLTGHADFYGLKLVVSPEVLIPRPETEELVHWIIEDNKHLQPVIFDIGTGSGCIALALKKNIPGARVLAMDVDGSALVLASKNAGMLELDMEFFMHDILSEIPPRDLPAGDIIVSNPPYIPAGEKKDMAPRVAAHEPAIALFVPDDKPLLFYDAIAGFSHRQLRPGGLLYLEINEKFPTEVLDLLRTKGFFDPELRRDINGKNRMIKAIRK